MSDGHYCFVRDLGPVKGGKGMKHHEVIIDFNRRGLAALLKRAFARSRDIRPSARAAPDGVPLRSRLQRAGH
jgi:hypothetical protein